MSDSSDNSASSEHPISDSSVPELQKQYRFQWEAAQDCFVLLYPEGLVKLPGSAGEIMKRLDGIKSVSEIVTDLEATFPGAELRQDVIDFLGAAYANGWIRS